MQVIGYGQPVHFVKKNKPARVWYCRFVYTSDTKIIKTSKLSTSMGDFHKEYNSTKIYSDFEQSNSDNKDNSNFD